MSVCGDSESVPSLLWCCTSLEQQQRHHTAPLGSALSLCCISPSQPSLAALLPLRSARPSSATTAVCWCCEQCRSSSAVKADSLSPAFLSLPAQHAVLIRSFCRCLRCQLRRSA